MLTSVSSSGAVGSFATQSAMAPSSSWGEVAGSRPPHCCEEGSSQGGPVRGAWRRRCKPTPQERATSNMKRSFWPRARRRRQVACRRDTPQARTALRRTSRGCSRKPPGCGATKPKSKKKAEPHNHGSTRSHQIKTKIISIRRQHAKGALILLALPTHQT